MTQANAVAESVRTLLNEAEALHGEALRLNMKAKTMLRSAQKLLRGRRPAPKLTTHT